MKRENLTLTSLPSPEGDGKALCYDALVFPRWRRVGELLMEEHDMTETIINELARRKVRYGLEGPFRYPHRISPAGDGSCFSRKRKTKGGTLLIDCSGSMHLSNADIRDIVHALPAAGYRWL